MTSVFQNKANKQRHQKSPIHQRKPETSETRRTLNIPQSAAQAYTVTEYALILRENSCWLWCWVFGCECVTCMLKSGPSLWCCPLCSPGNCRGDEGKTADRWAWNDRESVCYSEEMCVCAHDRGVKYTHQVKSHLCTIVLLTRKKFWYIKCII